MPLFTLVDDPDNAGPMQYPGITLVGTDGEPASFAETTVIMPVARFQIASGAVLSMLSGGNVRTPVYTLRDAQSDSIVGYPSLPVSWSSTHIDMWHTNLGAGAGNVVYRMATLSLAPSGDITAGANGSNIVVAAPAQEILSATPLRLASDVSLVTGQFFGMQITRLGADAADTLANSAGPVFLQFTKAS